MPIKSLFPKINVNRKYLSVAQAVFLLVILFVFSMVFLVATPGLIRLAQKDALLMQKADFESHNLNLAKNEVEEPMIRVNDLGTPPPIFTGEAILAEDLEADKILYQKNIHERLSPASTTKLMTAIIATNHFQSGDILTVHPEDLVSGSTMGLAVGEKLSFRSLLYGMLLNSGNDAAFTIASNYPGGLPMFILQMNKKAKELGLNDTRFQNPAGFDHPEHYSSAYDLSRIAKMAISNPQIAKVVATKETSISSSDNLKLHELKNLNLLLGEQGILGIKTGYTEQSGENFVGLVSRNNRKLLTVVLKSEDRFGETRTLIDWAYNNFVWQYVN